MVRLAAIKCPQLNRTEDGCAVAVDMTPVVDDEWLVNDWLMVGKWLVSSCLNGWFMVGAKWLVNGWLPIG